MNGLITKMFSVCIVAAMVIYWIVYERNTRKRKKQELQRDDYLFAKENDLPLQINWNEINDFLSDSEYGVNMPMEKWFMLDTNTLVCQKKYGRIYMTNLLRYMKEKLKYKFQLCES